MVTHQEVFDYLKHRQPNFVGIRKITYELGYKNKRKVLAVLNADNCFQFTNSGEFCGSSHQRLHLWKLR
jgi:hypothetical protein